jgi:uncharacterized membrane protein YhiD involved in acid resistance
MIEFLRKALGLDGVSAAHFGEILLRLSIAAVLGAFIAYRPWRRFLTTVPPPRVETAQAQTLISMAGALMVVVIGDNMARAFGLVGLGAFIRFRSGIKDPRDAAVLFVMIGVGMACGLGTIPIALVATGFAIAVLFLFDATGKARPRQVRLGITLDDPRGAFAEIRAAFPGARVLEIPNTNPERGKLVLLVDADENVDAATVLELLEQRGVRGVRNVGLEED